jgi:hypothetical protein
MNTTTKYSRFFVTVVAALVLAGCGQLDCYVANDYGDQLVPFQPSPDGMIYPEQGSGWPAVEQFAAPWDLTGNAYLMLVAMNDKLVEEQGFVPETLDERYTGSVAVVLLVDYTSTNAGPYKELLFVPGSFQFKQNKCSSITKIYVDSWESVVNGQENWGIPKDYADFDIVQLDNGEEEFSVFKDDQRIAYFRFKPARIPLLPVTDAIIPATIRTLAQHYKGNTYFYELALNGRFKPAQLMAADINA